MKRAGKEVVPLIKKDLVIVILTTVCLTETLFMVLPTSPLKADEYELWLNVNDDIRNDIPTCMRAETFCTSRESICNVNATHHLAATAFLTAVLNESRDDVFMNPRILRASNDVSLAEKNLSRCILFLSGGVSGGLTWSSWDVEYGNLAGGGCPGSGRVEVYDKSNARIAHFALPLKSLLIVQNASRIRVYAEAPIPTLSSFQYQLSSYSAFVLASVYWSEG